MPRTKWESMVDHGCCASRRARRQCGCLCHDFEMIDYTMHAPTKADFNHTELLWLVSRNGSGQHVGTVRERAEGGYGAWGPVHSDVGCLAIVEDPFDAAMILWLWAWRTA